MPLGLGLAVPSSGAGRGPAAGCHVDIPRAGRGDAAGFHADIPKEVVATPRVPLSRQNEHEQPGVLDELRADIVKLDALLMYHLLPQKLYTLDLQVGLGYPTLHAGEDIAYTSFHMLNGRAGLIKPMNQEASNGVLHTIDAVLTKCFRGADVVPRTGRGDAAAETWILRGDAADADVPRRPPRASGTWTPPRSRTAGTTGSTARSEVGRRTTTDKVGIKKRTPPPKINPKPSPPPVNMYASR